MTIAGQTIRGDLFIFPDGRISQNWWRREGHLLQADDLIDLLQSKPQLLVVGTGASGLMRPAPGLEAHLQSAGVEAVFLPTADAVARYNALLGEDKRFAACFHLTC